MHSFRLIGWFMVGMVSILLLALSMGTAHAGYEDAVGRCLMFDSNWKVQAAGGSYNSLDTCVSDSTPRFWVVTDKAYVSNQMTAEQAQFVVDNSDQIVEFLVIAAYVASYGLGFIVGALR